MGVQSTEATEEGLQLTLSEFGAAYAARDSASLSRFADDDFEIVFFHPELLRVSRDDWLEGIADYVSIETVAHRELLLLDGHSAIVHREVFRRSTSRGLSMEGDIAVAESWRYDESSGWRIWKRLVTPKDTHPAVHALDATGDTAPRSADTP